MVVAVAPVFGHSANLLQCGEHEAVQNLGAEGPVEALDVGILGWLSGLDVDEIDTVILGPLLQCLADEFRTIVQAQPFGRPAQFDQFVQGADDASRRQARVDFDLHRFPVEIVIDIEGSKTAT